MIRHIDTAPSHGVLWNAAAPVVELRDVDKSFRASGGPVQAVRGVSLEIEAGEVVALLGPNGAGKSTTIDILLGLAKPDSGSAALLGRAPGDAVGAGAVGAMLQTGYLIRDLSVRELTAMVASLYPAPLDVDEVLALVGIDKIAGRRTQKLSGGETQRVRFAIALVSNPELLVLDEPTTAMDVEGRRAFWTTMREFAARGKTVLFATHYLEEADAYADRALLMAGGRVVADGPTTEIKAMVGLRTIRATLPGADLDALGRLPGVARAERRGEAVVLSCTDGDAALRVLLREFPDARDVEIASAGLEEAFLQLTGTGNRRPCRNGGGAMSSATYVRYEVLRTFRNRRFFIFSLGFPVALFFLIAGPNRDEHNLAGTGISAPLYFMVSLAAFGAMNGVIAGGARIALERTVGWTRQLRLTPLTPRAYFATKILTAYLTALTTIAVLFVSGAWLGVSLPAADWLKVVALLVIGLLPFAALGIVLGHLLGSDALGPVIGGTTALLAFLGGTWFPLGDGALHDIAQGLPSYWLVQASHVALGGDSWGALGWLVTIGWTVALAVIAAWAYRRDTGRV